MNKGTKVTDSSPFKGEQEGVRAIILAAGTASRLRPLTLHTPKCLLKVGERTLLQRSMDALVKAGIRQFCIVTGYLHEQIEDFVRQTYGESIDVCFIHNKDYESTNNIYSLWLARPQADGQEVLLLDSDLLYDGQIVERVLADKHENVLTLIRHELGEEEMKVVMNGDGAITEISKTCDPASAAGESLGIERMGKAYTTALYKELDTMMNEEHLENKFYELAFLRLIAKGSTFSVLDVTDLFSCELDTIEDFENAKQRIPAHLY
ncbi:MAG: phosphocholine cytidylyltransferase family protein [Bacteroidaceae bacterium]|nr:phosphocholine cytidylyltransferase family protein [Bacteroidaceae bacterium]